MKKTLILSVLILFPIILFGQSKSVWLYKADEYFTKGDYITALTLYKKVLDDSVGMSTKVIPYEIEISNQKLKNTKIEADSSKKVSVEDYVNHQIGICYKKTYDYSHAANQFKITAENGSYPEDVYNRAVSLMNIKEYETAIEQFELFVRNNESNDSLVQKSLTYMTGCFYAMDENNVKEMIQIKLFDTTVFNFGTSSFAPMFWGFDERILFTSAREGGVVLDPERQNSEYLCDIYWTEKYENGEWEQPTNFGRPVNTSLHEGSASFSNNNIMFFTRWSDENKNEKNIFAAKMMNNLFFEAFKLDTLVNVEGYFSVNPFVSLDGSTLYFSSNRPGGLGGMDIWKIALDDETGLPYGDAINLGSLVNTAGDEITPFFHETTSTLYFSSNGHQTIGGFDVFKSRFHRDDSVYTEVKNLGMPINSSKDDTYLIWDKLLNTGYFSSDREDCPDGHCYKIYEIKNAPIVITLEGYSYLKYTEDIIPNVNLTFKDVSGEFDAYVIQTDENGFYSIEIPIQVEIFIKAQKEEYFADAGYVETLDISESTTLYQDFYLDKIPAGEIVIEGIEYDFDSDKLRPRSMEILDELYDFLVLNNNLTVEINAHTDCRGNDDYNMDLSARRAKSCVDYLISKGIPAERLISNGFGESQPSEVPDENGNMVVLTEAYIDQFKGTDKFEEYHQKNRRTAFKVTGQGFELKSN